MGLGPCFWAPQVNLVLSFSLYLIVVGTLGCSTPSNPSTIISQQWYSRTCAQSKEQFGASYSIPRKRMGYLPGQSTIDMMSALSSPVNAKATPLKVVPKSRATMRPSLMTRPFIRSKRICMMPEVRSR
jgi:hypothetical protein